MSYQDIINKQELQRIQEEFSNATGTTMFCIDENRDKLLNISGTISEKTKIHKYFKNGIFCGVLDRVEGDSLEDMAIEKLEGTEDQIAAIAVRVNGKTLFYWVLLWSNKAEEQARFYHVLDLLHDTSQVIFADKMRYLTVEAESVRNRYEKEKMTQEFRTIEAMTKIVQLLDDDDSIDVIVAEWIRILAEYLQIDTAQVFQLHTDANSMDVICEWRNDKQVTFFDRISDLPIPTILVTQCPLVLSSDDIQREYKKQLEQVGLEAVMIFPILLQDEEVSIVLSLNHRCKKHKWKTSEIKFTSDAVKVMQSIITRRIQKNSLTGSYRALEEILDNMGCYIYVVDQVTGEPLFENQSLQNRFAQQLTDQTFADFLNSKKPEELKSGLYELHHEDMNSWYNVIFKEIPWMDGRQVILYSLYDVSEIKQYQKEIERQAYTDFLTGLYNRMCCERDLARQIDLAKKSGKTGVLLYLDLDNFKHINDGLGHQYGDILLQLVSKALSKIKEIQSSCYRMGGDEFVIVISPEYYEQSDRIIDEISQIFNKPWYLKDEDYYCTMSMGVVLFPNAGDSVADLVKKADIAMYEAKKSGKNKVNRYREGVEVESGRRLNIEKNMRDATITGCKEFEVYYQPIFDMEHEEKICVGAEALVRWNSEKMGFVAPTEFIPMAEYLGLINPIGNYILREACEHCSEWNRKGYPYYHINVNLSVVQLLQTDIVELIERTLEETRIKPENLILEVTESIAINDMDRMKKILNQIKSLGVKIALDDFGTGYSSLNHIKEISVDVIKVDQSFVTNMLENTSSQSLVQMIVDLGEAIDASICVEGIETQEQYDAIQDMKVKYVQGYYFDKPMSSKKFEAKYVKCIAKEQ